LSWPGMQVKADSNIDGLIFVRQARTMYGCLIINIRFNKFMKEGNV
jgi:hypothetical protein